VRFFSERGTEKTRLNRRAGWFIYLHLLTVLRPERASPEPKSIHILLIFSKRKAICIAHHCDVARFITQRHRENSSAAAFTPRRARRGRSRGEELRGRGGGEEGG
jgi:hypothetical protein